MENTLGGGAAGGSIPTQSAVQNKSGASISKLVLLWLAVGIPLLWGALKALQEPGNLMP